jgi:chemotaxis protein histidine kinase CheA
MMSFMLFSLQRSGKMQKELLTAITDGLMRLEQTVGHPDPVIIEDVFRKTHSLKGAAGQ